MKKNKVLLIGWDSADWKVIDRLIAEGKMPTLKAMIEEGVKGKIATLNPPLSPMLWTSIATGFRPYKHGVIGFVEPDGKGSVRPVSSNFRKVKAIWNILTMEGYKSNIIGWWPSNPVETINGCMVSNMFQQEKNGSKIIEQENWEVQPATVHPERIIDKIKDLRVHPHEITLNLVSPFVPNFAKLGKGDDSNLGIISKFLAHASTVHAAATELMETEEWDFTAVYHDALDHFSHGFMRFYPPKMAHIDEVEFEMYKNVVEGAYIFHDMMLERLLGMVDDKTTVMIVSDHGFHSDHMRPIHIPQVPAGPAIEHAPYGIIVAKGPNIKKGEQIFGASVLDVTPTLLMMMGLPIGKDMDGKPLVDMFSDGRKATYIESWEKIDKFGGELVKIDGDVENDVTAALQQLIELGYIDDLNIENVNEKDRVKNIIKENSFYLAKSYSSTGLHDDALELLLEVETKSDPDYRILHEIVNCAVKTNRFALANEYLQFIRKEKILIDFHIDILDAKVQIGLNQPKEAIKLLNKALKVDNQSVIILLDLANIYNGLQMKKEALKCFNKVLALDPENAHAYYGKGLAYLRADEYEKAVEEFLNAIDRLYHFPLAHLYLGESLALMKEYEAAIGTFELVKTMMPNLPKVYRWLQDLYDLIDDPIKSRENASILGKMHLDKRTIICGLPGPKMEDALSMLKQNKVNIGKSFDVLKTQNLDVLKKDWFSQLEGDVIYLPLQYFPSLNSRNLNKFIFIKDSLEDTIEHMNKKAKIKANTFNFELMNNLNKIEESTKSWFGKQPDVDVYYLSNLDKLMEII
ncbi:MAG: hypothetical protein RI922_1409 [Bacteroidota bacterium]|jgi:predicted AlkP superfamily phosphohydrolase/phosphomutase/tetratricopeptide (TPR) repeat protein